MRPSCLLQSWRYEDEALGARIGLRLRNMGRQEGTMGHDYGSTGMGSLILGDGAIGQS